VAACSLRAVADLSWVIAGMGGMVGGVAAEVSNQRRVARRLRSRSAARWEALGGWERYRMGRELRRGRALDRGDAELGAEVAEALRAEFNRRWSIWLAGGLAVLFVLLTVVTLAAGKLALAGIEAVVTVVLILTAAWPPHVRRRLAVAEEANRALADARGD
jgi:hypothetical protein